MKGLKHSDTIIKMLQPDSYLSILQIATRLGLQKQSVSDSLHYCKEEGWVTDTVSEDPYYSTKGNWSLTPKGLARKNTLQGGDQS